jgi:hypothetical protein
VCRPYAVFFEQSERLAVEQSYGRAIIVRQLYYRTIISGAKKVDRQNTIETQMKGADTCGQYARVPRGMNL